MYKVIKRLHFCYGHRLLDYEGKCARPHGHNAVVEIELSQTSLDSAGMVRDFAEVKEALRGLVEGRLDHRMLLRKDDVLVEALREAGEDPYVMDVNPTAEHIARLLFEEAHKQGFPVTAVRLWETPDSCAEVTEVPEPRRRGAG